MQVFYQDYEHLIEAEGNDLLMIIQFIINNIRKNTNTNQIKIYTPYQEQIQFKDSLNFEQIYLGLPEKLDTNFRTEYVVDGNNVKMTKFQNNVQKESVQYQIGIMSKMNENFEVTFANFNKKRMKVGNDGKSQALFMQKSKEQKQNQFIQVSKLELLKHNTPESAWIVINGIVYDITYYLDCHPGGRDILLPSLGTDGTELFNQYHHWVNAQILLKNWVIGSYTR